MPWKSSGSSRATNNEYYFCVIRSALYIRVHIPQRLCLFVPKTPTGGGGSGASAAFISDATTFGRRLRAG